MTSLAYQYDDFMNPVLQAIRELGGSGTNEEINTKVAQIAQILPEQLDLLHNPAKGGMTEFEYRLMWTRTYLKKYGLIDNSTRGVWSLTPTGAGTPSVDEKLVTRAVKAQAKQGKETTAEDELDRTVQWQQQVLDAIQKMPPDAFERLAQRLLRESGFIQVEVTGRTGDGGIDGHGILRLGGLISFNVIFQCKKWQNSVGASQVRDFRGAMVGRADKGLFITTGSFTKEAVKEATRDGAPTIDLVDGDQLAEKLKQLSLGVQTKLVTTEQVEVDSRWFERI